MFSNRKTWKRGSFIVALTESSARLILPLLLLFVLMLSAATSARAAGCMCSDYAGGVVDGSNPATYATIASCSTFGIDMDCTIKNFPAPSGFPITNVNYQFWGNSTFFIIFDNVYYTGNMSCNNPSQATFWIYWAPGSFTDISEKCQDRMLPVDVTTKQNPSGQTTALIGVPFTYTITAPLKAVWDVTSGVLGVVSPYDDEPLYNVVITDDLTKTGAALTYVSNTAYLVDKKNNLPRISIGPLNVTTSDNKHLTFSYTNNHSYLDKIPAGYNLVIDLTVVLDGSPVGVNPPMTTFTNFAEMWFDKVYQQGTPDERWERFHAEFQITPPLMIVGPDLVVDKSTTATTLNVGGTAPYKIDVKNAGSSTAFNVTIKDDIPAGMCMFDPRSSVVAGIYAADGITLVSPLTLLNGDYSLAWTGPTASACSLTLTFQSTPAARIEPTQRLIITYNAKLDAGAGTGLDFTNVAGATNWFNASSSPRFEYVRGLTDGTPSVDDFQDAQAIRSAVEGYYFLKTIEDRTTGDYPARQAFPGDRLRYTLVLQNYTWPTLENITITDDLGRLTSGVFASGINIISNTFPVSPTFCPSCGTNGAPQITLTGFSRALITDSDPEYKLVFDVILNASLGSGTLVSNQALLSGQVINGGTIYTDAKSDDPNDAGGAVLLGDAATGPTNLTIQAPGALTKANPAGKTTATIGEQFTYTITVPPDPVNVYLYDVQIKDTLPANLAFMSATAHLVSGTKSWNLIKEDGAGFIILKDALTGIDIPPNDKAIVEVTVQVRNDAINDIHDGNDTFTNTAWYTYNKLNDVLSEGIGGSGTTGVMTVTEPLLTVKKEVKFYTPSTKVWPNDSSTVGDVLEYTVTIHNTGTSTAYDTNIVDTLPPNVNYLIGSTTAKIDGATVSVLDPLMNPPMPSGTPLTVTWGDGNGDDSLDIPVGKDLVLTYRVTVVDASSAPSFANTVYVDWTSFDGPNSGERTGQGCPNITQPNDYCTGPASVIVTTADNTSIVKSVNTDSYVEDTSTAPHVLRVGDTATYDLTLNLQEYTTLNVVVQDVLPAGMALQSFNYIRGNLGINFTPVLPEPAPGATGTLTWNLGSVQNPADGNSSDDILVIRVVAQVVTTAPPTGVDYTTSILLNNTAKLSYTGGDPVIYPSRLTTAATIEVHQPLMSTITKSASVVAGPAFAGGDGLTSGTAYQVDVANNKLKFHLVSCNTGSAPAYNVRITDVLASQLDETTIANLAVTVAGSPAVYAYSYDAVNRLMSFVLSTVNSSQCVTIDYTIGFHTNIAADQTWSNQAKLPQYESLPATGRIYAPADIAQVWMTNKVIVQPLTKTLTSPSEATIGETVSYQITVPGTAMNTALNNVAVSETLHNAFAYESAAATLNGAPVTLNTLLSGQTVTWSLSVPITAGQQAVITLTARVANNDYANAGTSIVNTASYTYAGIPAGSVTNGSSNPLTIVEPSVSIAKAVSPTSPPSAGDTLHYTVTMIAASSASFSSAFDAGLVDTLSLGLAYVAGTARVGGAAVEPSVTGDGTSTPQILTWAANINISEGTSVFVTYDVRVLGTVVAGQMLTNSVTAKWTSLAGANSNERTGDGGINDYFTGPVATQLKVSDNNSLTKAIIADTYVDAPSTATDKITRIGDTATYRLTLKLGEGTNSSVKVQDVLPAGMAYDSLVSISPASGTSTFTYNTPVPQPAPGATGTLTWDLGNVVNTPSGDNTPFDALIIEYKARVLPNAGIAQVPATSLPNTATLSYVDAGGNPVVDPARLVSSDSLTLRQPVMSAIVKLGNGASNTATTPLNVNVATTKVHFQLKSCNTSGLAPAYSVKLTDVLATQLNESITPPVVAVGGTVLSAGTYTYTAPTTRGGSMIFVLNTPVNPGQCVTVDYDIGFHTDFGPNQTWNNSASLNEYWSLPAKSGQQYTPAGSSQFYMTNTVNVTRLSKTLKTAAEATIGETVKYEITVPGTPANAELSNMVVTDTLHNALVFSSATGTLYSGATGTSLNITTSQAGQTVTMALGAIPAGQQAVITLYARVANNAQANAGTSVTNTASYTYTNIPAGSVTSGTSGPLTIIEPSVSVTKNVANVTQPGAAPKAGDILRYTVSLTAASGAKFSSAFDAGLVDTLSLGLAYQTGTSTVNGAGNTITDPTYTGDGSTTPQTLTWASGIDIFEGTKVTITYDVKVLDVVAGQVLTNSVTVRWTSLDSLDVDNAFDRTGVDGIGGLNDYVATAAAPPLTVPIPALTFKKTVDKPVANPGDLLRYTISIQNPTGIRVANFSLVDEIDRLNATPRFQGSINIISCPTTTTSPVICTSNGGTLTVTGMNIGLNETLTIAFEAALATNLKSGTVVLNQAVLQGPWTTPVKSDDPNVAGAANPTQTVIPADGVVYDAASRKALGGVTLTMRLASTATDLPASCFIDPGQQNQVTPANGTYKFDLNFSQPDCPAGADYLIAVSAVSAGYVAGPSLVILPTVASAYSVPACSGDAIPSTQQCEAQVSATAPTGAVTTYYLHLTLDSTANQIFNNHIPVDPYVEEKISITKTSPLINVTRGQLVPYTITFKNSLRSTLPPLGIVDTLPPGFKYVEGSSRFNGTPLEPAIDGLQLRWNNLDIGYNKQHTIKLLLVVGAGVSEGEYVNRVQVIATVTGGPFSEVAMATVRVVPDPTFDCTDVVGKVFDDRDLNGQQDAGERGLPGVRVVTARGLIATTDQHGRFHVTCAVVPDEIRGSNFILKLDDRTLPTGYRVTTENPRVQRATRGKMLRFSFGATTHHVVSMDIADGAFEPKSTLVRMQWQSRIDLLLKELRKAPSVLRLSYLADVENDGLVEKRLKALKKEIAGKWDGAYQLTIETEVFWRRGSPP